MKIDVIGCHLLDAVAYCLMFYFIKAELSVWPLILFRVSSLSEEQVLDIDLFVRGESIERVE